MMKAIVKLSATTDELAVQNIPPPMMGDTEMLVRIQAIGVGIHDGYFLPNNITYPYVIDIEAAGVVESIGAAVSEYQPGERIAFVSAMQPKGGTWAEYAVVDAHSLIIRIPDSLTFEQAAAVPVAGNTAIKAFRCLDLNPGDSLFIAGGSGAIGTFAIQLAVKRGLRVIASASSRNHDYMRALGAEHVVDYQDEDWPEKILSWFPSGVNAAIAVLPETSQQCESVVRSSGSIVTISGDHFQPGRNIELQQIPYAADITVELEELINQIGAGKMHLAIERIYPFAEGLDALAKAQTRRARGKLVLTLGDAPPEQHPDTMHS